MWLDKINIEQGVGEFTKVSGLNAWNASARYFEYLSREASGTIGLTVNALTDTFVFGYSDSYLQGQRGLQYGIVLEGANLISLINGTEQANGTVEVGDYLEISKERNSADEFLLVFRKNGNIIDSTNIGYNWRVYVMQFSLYTANGNCPIATVTIIPPTIIPLPELPELKWWQENGFITFFPQHWKEEDSYKSQNPNDPFYKKGFVQRYVEMFGKYLDEEILPLIRLLVSKVSQAQTVEDTNMAFLEGMFGVDLTLIDDINTRRRILQTFLEFTKLKGSKRGFEVGIKMIRFQDLVIDYVDIIPDYTGHTVNKIVPYQFGVSGNFSVITENLKNAMFKVARYNEPIYWGLKSLIYNDNELVDEVALFYFLGYDDPNLYYDHPKVPDLDAFFLGANLMLSGTNAEFYEYDNVYLDNKGSLIFRKPASGAIPFFVSNPCDNVGTNTFRVNWSISSGADSYVINVGKSRTNTQSVITEKVVDNLVVANTNSSWTIFDLEENTPYFVQVTALHNGKIVRSPIQSVITRKTLSSPIATLSMVDYYGFIAEWNVVEHATGYRIDVATDLGFTDLLLNNFLLDYPIIKYLVELPNTGTFYYRVKAVKRYDNNENRTAMLESTSGWSNTVTVIAEYTDHSEIDYASDYN